MNVRVDTLKKSGVQYPFIQLPNTVGGARSLSGAFERVLFAPNINDLIEDEVNDILFHSCAGACEIGATYEIKRFDERILSVVFSGTIYREASYPRKVLSDITIDILKGEQIFLSRLVNVDEDFVKMVVAGADLQLGGGFLLTDLYSYDQLFNILLNHSGGTGDGSEARSYLSEDSLTVRIAVPHALGDFVAVTIGFSHIERHINDEYRWLIETN
ncbi:MAG: hypothetical protein FWF88_08610 [Peptococcaceae bacterium]|nr:hypothetical protein [Peptococcaceae bacterium]